jgi:toxin FitB
VFLVDTNVISASTPGRRAHPDLMAWMEGRSSDLFLSAVTIAEIEAGIAKSSREGARSKSRALAAWLETLMHLYSNRVLPFDTDVAHICGRLADKARAAGRKPGFADLIIAATALQHDLILLTRNIKHFAPLKISLANPFERLPD